MAEQLELDWSQIEHTCDYCRLPVELEELEVVEWMDSTGDVWERLFCSSCRTELGL